MLLSKFGAIASQEAAGGGGGEDNYGITSFGTVSALTQTREVGNRYQVGASNITVTKLRVYLPYTATVTANLWSDAGSLLGSVSISAIANTWSEGALSSSVTINFGDYFVVSVGITQYYYGASSGFSFNDAIAFVSAKRSGTGATGAFPTTVIANTVYGVSDIVW